MSFHHDPEQWLFQAPIEDCPYCRRDKDPLQPITLKRFKLGEMCARPQVCLRGICSLITGEHSSENRYRNLLMCGTL